MKITIDNNMKRFFKIFLLGLLGMITIITCSGVWNGVYLTKDLAENVGSFYGWVAGLDFIASGVGLYFLGKKWVFKKED